MTEQSHLMDSPISASLNKRHFRDMDYDKPAIHNICPDNNGFYKITAGGAMPLLCLSMRALLTC